MNHKYKIEVPTEQGYNQVLMLNHQDITKLKELLLKGEGTQCIGSYSLRVESDSLSLYKYKKFDGSCYVMSIGDTLRAINDIDYSL